MKLKKNLLNLLNNKFSSYGYQKFTVDELANELYISKKTIYKNFVQKGDLVRKLLIDKLNLAYTVIVTKIKSQTNIVDMFVKFSKMIKNYFFHFDKELLNKLKHYNTKLANEIITFKNEHVIPLIKLLLRAGRKQKIKLGIQDEIIIKVFASSLSSIAEIKNNGNHNL